MTLAAADKLRSQGFLRTEQNLPKTNKRGERLCLSSVTHTPHLLFVHCIMTPAQAFSPETDFNASKPGVISELRLLKLNNVIKRMFN